ncbi:vWA domain-containing protein [Nocardia sp. XZ_19_231]|uniref:vWA domain-containing protein n=1 Tax=Nocardia sp. XZ_19_231 TaxID=2769252 RepID=UPI00188DCF2F|nr:vWA domain-containing protein [Nocardia sp. XZ_19_231]
MTDSDRTLIAVLLDRSGSMQTIKADTEGGLAAYFEQQRSVPKKIEVTLAQFDTTYDVVYANVPLAQVPAPSLHPRGGTALYDALGKLVTSVGAELADRPEHDRPGTVIIVVLTDGHENSSREWTHAAVKSLITQQQDVYNWTFVFLGANMDAVEVGSNLGFDPGSAITYAPVAGGVRGAFDALSAYSARAQAAPAGAARRARFSASERRQADQGK